jgi:hypothetical protein
VVSADVDAIVEHESNRVSKLRAAERGMDCLNVANLISSVQVDTPRSLRADKCRPGSSIPYSTNCSLEKEGFLIVSSSVNIRASCAKLKALQLMNMILVRLRMPKNDLKSINVHIDGLLNIQNVSNIMAMKIVGSSRVCRISFTSQTL